MIRKIWREEYMSEPKMTLEYMIYKLDDAVVIGDDETVGRMIKQVWPQLGAALRAGQAMRKESDITIQYLTMTGQKYRNAYDDACQAWDAAIGEET